MTKEVSGSNELPSGGFTVRVELPWSRDIIVVLTDSGLLDVFREIGNHGYDQIRFQMEKTPHSPIDEPEVVEQIGWCNKEAGMFDFTVESEGEDTESDDAQFEEGLESDGDTGEGFNSGVGVGLDGMENEGVQTGEGVNNGVGVGLDGMEDEGLDDDVVDEDEISKQCMTLFDGYESRSDDDYFTDHDEESSDQKKTKISLGNLSEGEYAIREGVTLGRVKNDIVRQTYVCNSEGCLWRAHGSRTIDKKSFIFKTLDDKHDCHRVYNNSEAKVKWIASRVESFVKSNPTVGAKVLGDLILERHLCFMSDRQKSLVKALQTHFLLASTRFCARHIYANFRSSYPGHNYKKMFWKASRSSNLFHFIAALDSIGEVDLKAKQWLMKIATLLVQLLEFIRRMVMKKLQERKEECEAWRDVLQPRVNMSFFHHHMQHSLAGLNCKGREKLERKQNEVGQGQSYASCVGWQATTKGLAKLTSLQEAKRKNVEQKEDYHHNNLSQQLQPQHHHNNLNQQLHQDHNHHLIRKQM
ncbi:hypothetical protein Ddye_032340 [Dipteronia dyeriana]|uniref:Transposase MuDR plant domain-containing protein n=1 Tax=Dipteronia dyeriana TaxID=168575 RepID=A0AAD9WPF3_9ROSI|nr:hypothetical protein Ddye_032340 [Dipteronia dyeriana]